MRLIIETNSGKRITIPLPICIMKLFTRKWFVSYMNKLAMNHYHNRLKSNKHVVLHGEIRNSNYEKENIIEFLDLRELRRSLDVLKRYRGLNIVDIQSENGEKVKITI